MSDAIPVQIECVHAERLCHAMQQNATPVVSMLRVQNVGAASLRNVEVEVRVEPALADPVVLRADVVETGTVHEFAAVRIALRAEALANATERQRADLVVAVRSEGAEVARRTFAIEVLAYNEWPGRSAPYSLLAAFVLPNHPVVAQVLRDAANRLLEETGSASLDGYQSGEPGRPLQVARAVYEVLRARNLAYVTPPASFESHGQKVRTPEQVLEDGMGTCLDLAVLCAAALEQAGLRPLLLLVEGHALCGVHLRDETATEPTNDDPLPLRKRIALERAVVFECTTLCAGATSQPFAKAVSLGRVHVEPAARFHAVVDVAACRKKGIHPLPVRTTNFALEPAAVVAESPADDEPVPFVVERSGPRTSLGARDRLDAWRKRLLDLSLRNRLLNFVTTKKSVSLQYSSLDDLVRALASGAAFRLLGGVAETVAKTPEEQVEQAARRAEFLRSELRARRLHADLKEPEVAGRALELVRQARIGHEESGVNTLFLAVGFLRWFETPTSQDVRFAPLLLLPMRIERVSSAEGYALSMLDDEPRVNETLVQKLEHDFGIRVEVPSELDGEDGPNLGAVLDAFRSAIVDVPRWEVEELASLGIFSFAKFLMWQDLDERRELVMQHELLRHLVEKPKHAFAQPTDGWPAPEDLDVRPPQDLLCPLDADSSQLCAVVAGAEGKSFVLEGPPGTGKSQTITNLIAQALANGKKVLFVAEKRAALEVVQRRLRDVGLAPFCLELHAGKGNKRAVVEQLGKVLELAQCKEPADWQRRADELLAVRKDLNAVAHAVHRVRGAGLSVFEAAARAVDGRRAGNGNARLLERLPLDVDADGMRTRRAAIATLASVAVDCGELRGHPWFGVLRPNWDAKLAPEAVALGNAARQRANALRPAHDAAAALLFVPSADAASRQQLLAFAALVTALAEGPVPEALLTAADFPAQRERAERCVAAAERAKAAFGALAGRWREELLQQDLAALQVAVLRAESSFFVLRWMRLRSVQQALQSFALAGVPERKDLRALLDTALSAAAAVRELADLDADGRAAFGGAWRGRESDPAALRAVLVRASAVREAIDGLVPVADRATLRARVAVTCVDGKDVLAAAAAAHAALREASAQLQQKVSLCFDRAFGTASEPGFLARLDARVDAFSSAPSRLRDMCAFRREAEACAALGLEAATEVLERALVDAHALPGAFESSFADAWLERELARDPALKDFRSADHERRIAAFRELDRAFLAIAADLVRSRLAVEVPSLQSAPETSELGVLQRELKKRARHLSPRQLFLRMPNLLPRLAPCLLTSPMTVAQVLSPSVPLFDLVVFDEASQVPMWDAVGAISRGKSLVVVGDGKQLPPTSFFQRVEDGDDDVADEVVPELESVLDECSAAGLRSLQLRWHYRSRHESLIAFSNKHYYDERLFTFPSAQREGALGVQLVKANGVYDRAGTQQNRIEAEALVAELVRLLRDPAGASSTYGVVTFSQSQQTLVEDLLELERSKHPEIERHFANAHEPVFVKNLENVQGDERDVMLFSICYGPDAQGRVYMQFGPLGQQGGERRLNVAITRARSRLLVFSSLRPEQIELQRTEAVGVRHLRAFLDYAERGEQALRAVVRTGLGGPESPFERDVLRELVAMGHEVHTQVGCSGYRIDLAIVDPRNKGRFVLGVECDGASYHSAATARDRDRLRQSVLERLGWRLFRIWSTDWWQDREGELRRFAQAFDEAMAEPVPQDVAFAALAQKASANAATAVPASTKPEAPLTTTTEPREPQSNDDESLLGKDTGLPAGIAAYVPCRLEPAPRNADLHEVRHRALLRSHLETVLAEEAPIVLDLLVRRVAEAWSIGRVTSRVVERVRGALDGLAVERDGALWPAGGGATGADSTGVASRPPFRGNAPGEAQRDPEELPVGEVRAAMAWMLRQHGSLRDTELLRETARLFGFARLGNAVREAMGKALAELERDGEVRRTGDVIAPAS